MPSIIQTALAVEAAANTPAVVALVFFPADTLRGLFLATTSITSVAPTTTFLARWSGLFIGILTPPILLAIPDTPGRAEKRKLVYQMLGLGEVAFLALLLWEAFRATDAEKMVTGGGFSRNMALVSAANMAGFLAWRYLVLFAKPEWLGGAGKVEVPKALDDLKNK